MKQARFITHEQAVSLLSDSENIHTFRQSGFGLIGADWSRKGVIDTMKAHEQTLQIGGDQCRKMRHGLVLNDGDYLFIEVDTDKLNEFDPK